jgi:UDP-glucuronate 4-epimerase
MKILVTGAAGFIGSNLVDQLLEEGNEVVVIDNFDPYYDPAIKERNIAIAQDYSTYTLYREDIANTEALENIFDKHNFELVVHLAAKAGVRPSIEDPQGYFRANITGTLNILEAMRKRDIKKLVYASSSSVYGNNKKVPFAETDNVDYPVSPYAATKKANELMVYNYHHLFGLNAFGLRFFTVYGRRGRPEMAIYKFTKMINEGIEVPVYGYGKPLRDFTYIDDILQGIRAAMKKVSGYEVFNLGESQTTSVGELIDLIERAVGKTAIRKPMPMQPGDVNETYADISKAKRLLGYKPTTPIASGVGKFVEWYFKEVEKLKS